MAGAAVVALIAGGIVGALTISGSHSSHQVSIGEAALVSSAAQRTLSEKTADLTVSGLVQVAGHTVPMQGTGATDFVTNAMSLDIHATAAAQSLVEDLEFTGGNLYFDVSVNGQGLAQADGGRPWVELPLASSASSSLSVNPVDELAVLEQRGASVRSLGAKNIDGERCTGYGVKPSKQAMVTAAQAEIVKLGVPGATQAAILKVARDNPPPTYDIWIDSHGLARQMNVALQLSAVSTSVSVAGNIVVDFIHYGVPVQVRSPAPSQTISYQDLLKVLGQTSGA